ncbi:hypothetical protein OOZ63_03725 [Paucibacter sp. PLA-PC-4]|uniref:hypothetical protein n=1 Tax=Paucibacter sp. PLA-PC-4 TaxID=2993655 RepID=UPI0022491275|nr:hypothetical protein [Paucibacter sp. PLA-PC-4]MCX2860943.1 hypothetical protein [Paucibacter sp. PLA-PC-4]
MKSQALITVENIQASSGWCQAKLGATVPEHPKVNPYAGHREVWLRAPNGCTVVSAGRYDDPGPEAAR